MNCRCFAIANYTIDWVFGSSFFSHGECDCTVSRSQIRTLSTLDTLARECSFSRPKKKKLRSTNSFTYFGGIRMESKLQPTSDTFNYFSISTLFWWSNKSFSRRISFISCSGAFCRTSDVYFKRRKKKKNGEDSRRRCLSLIAVHRFDFVLGNGLTPNRVADQYVN